MDILFRQLRTRYPEGGQHAKERSSPIIEQKIPPQRTQSFKGERKRSPSWIRKQFSRQMSQDYDSNNTEDYQTAVAAAAFAVKSLEETNLRDDGKGRHSREGSMTKIKSKADDTARGPEPRTRSIKFSDVLAKPNLDAHDKGVQMSPEPIGKMTEKAVGVAPSIKKKVSFTDTAGSSQPETALPAEKAIGPAPSIKKTPTFGDKSLERTPSRKSEIAEPNLDVPPLKRPQFQPDDTRSPSPNKLGIEDTEADAWEKAEMAKIREKYEKLKTKLLDWENKKKQKAKRKLQKTEAELDKRRAKAIQHYRSELSRTDDIVGGARSKAIENQKNEELKVKEKANKIRLTGKFPGTCLCC